MSDGFDAGNLIPIVAIAGSFAIPIVAIVMDFKRPQAALRGASGDDRKGHGAAGG